MSTLEKVTAAVTLISTLCLFGEALILSRFSKRARKAERQADRELARRMGDRDLKPLIDGLHAWARSDKTQTHDVEDGR